MTANRSFGLALLVLGAILLLYISTGLLVSAPLLLVFGSLGGLGAVAVGVWALLGKV